MYVIRSPGWFGHLRRGRRLHGVGILLHRRAGRRVAVRGNRHGHEDGAGSPIVLVGLDAGPDKEGEVDEKQQNSEGQYRLFEGYDRADPVQVAVAIIVVVVRVGVIAIVVVRHVYGNIYGHEAERNRAQEPYDEVERDICTWMYATVPA